jgi:tRNA pseudouridine13 synthase
MIMRAALPEPGAFAPCIERHRDLAYAAGRPAATALLRSLPEDFQVDEVLGYPLSGEGTHAWLRIRKRNANTEWVARQLARLAGAPPNAVGYAGLKDRLGVTTQWLSVDLNGRQEPDWREIESEEIHLLSVTRHGRKLRQGRLSANRFTLVLREVAGDRQALEARLSRLPAEGVPNYFGSQRFGHGGGNLQQAAELFSGHLKLRRGHLRGLYLSAARSMLFNLTLAARVADASWNRILPGEVLVLDGSHSFFATEAVDEVLLGRLASGDIHPSGPLWGRGRSPASGEALDLEAAVLAGCKPWCDALEWAGMSQERRPLRALPRDLSWRWLDETTLELCCELGRGTYATSLLRELVDTAAPD